MSRGKLNTTELLFTSTGTTQAKLTATLNEISLSGNSGNNDITLSGLLDPTSNNHAANKQYVDSQVQTNSPGGSNTYIQYNDNSSFGGSVDLTWNDTSKLLSVSGKSVISAPNASGTPSNDGTIIEIQGHTFTDNTGNATAIAVFSSFSQPTLAASTPITTTTAATLYIENSPVQGTNQTITNNYSLWVDAGNVKFDGDLITDGIINTTNTTASTSETTGALIVAGGVGISGATYTNTMFINNEEISGTRVISAYDATGGVAISGTITGLIFDTSIITDTGYSLNTGTGVITITDAGTYCVSYWISMETLDQTGSADGVLSGYIQTDPAGGSSFSTISGSISTALMIESNTTGKYSYGCGKELIIDITSGTTLRIAYNRSSGTTTAQTTANVSSVCIKRLRP